MATGGAEEHFAKKLANNEKKIRDRAVKKLQVWLGSRPIDGPGFDEVDLLKIWKGLFYCMWMSDKPLIQEELAVNISMLIHSFKSKQSALLFIKTFFKTMEREWHGIDRLRLDKFYMLIRFFVTQSFCFLKENHWEESLVNDLCIVYQDGPLNPGSKMVPDGICLHVSAVYLPELRSAAENKIQPTVLLKLLDPLFLLAAHAQSKPVVSAVRNNLLENIFQFAENDTHEMEEGMSFQVNTGAVIDRLFNLASDRSILGRNRNQLFGWIKRLRKLSEADPVADLATEDIIKELPESMRTDLGKTMNSETKRTGENDTQPSEPKCKRKKKKTLVEEKDDSTESSKKIKICEEKEEASVLGFPTSNEVMDVDTLTFSKKSKKKKRKCHTDENHAQSIKRTCNTGVVNKSSELDVTNATHKEDKMPLDPNKVVTNEFNENDRLDREHSQEESCNLLQSKAEINQTKSQHHNTFARFQRNSTPPAFVRKCIPKTPKTAPVQKHRHSSKQLNSGSQSAQKKVKIEVSKNTSHTAQDYQRSLMESPKIPFDAQKTPTQGLLKSSPKPTRRVCSAMKNASFTDPVKQLKGKHRSKILHRPKAMDFF